jgi:hypothetical protein
VDIASILNELWRRRTWVGVGIVVAGVIAMSVVFNLPSLEKKSTVTAAASTDVLVDTRSSALGSIAIDVNELTTRAGVYARMIGTPAVKERIAGLVGAPAEKIGILDMGMGTSASRQAGSAETAPGTMSPGTLLLGATTQEAHPAVKLQALASTPAAAKRLADAAAQALITYVAGVQRERAIPPRERVVLRQLGSPQAIVLVEEVGFSKAIGAFIGVLLAWCLLLLVVSRIAAALRELRAADDMMAPENDNLLVGLWDETTGDGRLEELRADRDLTSPSRRARR